MKETKRMLPYDLRGGSSADRSRSQSRSPQPPHNPAMKEVERPRSVNLPYDLRGGHAVTVRRDAAPAGSTTVTTVTTTTVAREEWPDSPPPPYDSIGPAPYFQPLQPSAPNLGSLADVQERTVVLDLPHDLGGRQVVTVQPGGSYCQHPSTSNSTQEIVRLVPGSIPDCPPGLEMLHYLDRIICNQKVDVAEMFSRWECANRYAIKTFDGQQIYYAFEESISFMGQCFGNSRGFTIHVVDNQNQEVFTIERPVDLIGGCSCCATSEVSVRLPDGTPLGHVFQQSNCCCFAFTVFDGNGRQRFSIGTDDMCECGSVAYEVTGDHEEVVGEIKKCFGGIEREFFSKADKFKLTFAQDLDVRLKAVLIGATFLIDFLVFEQNS